MKVLLKVLLSPWFSCRQDVNCVLLFDRKVLEQRDQVYEKISQYLQLKNTIQSLQVLTRFCSQRWVGRKDVSLCDIFLCLDFQVVLIPVHSDRSGPIGPV